MIKVPYEEILTKIHEKTNVSISELEERVDKKLQQLSGLISKEGAAHIIANELGVRIFEQLSGKLQIKNIVKGLRDVEAVARVAQVYDVREFFTADRAGKVASMIVGDETGTVKVVMWGSQAEQAPRIKPNDIVKVIGAYVKDNNGKTELHLNDRSQLFINPKNETVAEIKFETKTANRKSIKDLAENDSEVELLGTLVQMFELRFFEVCPKCSKRAKPADGLYACAEHGSVMPAYSYVLNAVVDDGTETMRCVFFRNQVDKLLNKSPEQLASLRVNPSEFEVIKSEVLGQIVKLNGRVNKNTLFSRLEFVVNSVDSNPNPEEELKRVQNN